MHLVNSGGVEKGACFWFNPVILILRILPCLDANPVGRWRCVTVWLRLAVTVAVTETIAPLNLIFHTPTHGRSRRIVIPDLPHRIIPGFGDCSRNCVIA